MVTPGPEEQMNAPPLVPQPALFRLPVLVEVNPPGLLNKLKLLMFELGVKPKSTPPMTLLVEFGAELIVMESVACEAAMSKEYVAPGQPEPGPQSVNTRVPTVSALAGTPKMTITASSSRACKTLRIKQTLPLLGSGQRCTMCNSTSKRPCPIRKLEIVTV